MIWERSTYAEVDGQMVTGAEVDLVNGDEILSNEYWIKSFDDDTGETVVFCYPDGTIVQNSTRPKGKKVDLGMPPAKTTTLSFPKARLRVAEGIEAYNE